MREGSPTIYIARHGETEWSRTGQHTGLTDLPLTANGERAARQLGERLKSLTFGKVFTSPLKRAATTCELAGFGSVAETARELVEWDYGDYEGLRLTEIHERRPNWEIFRDGCPGGEATEQIVARADRMIERIRAVNDDVLFFSSGHFIKVFTSRWIGLDPVLLGPYLALNTASLSIVGYAMSVPRPMLQLWNDDSHITS